jgi:hypothetical protein
MNHAKTQRRKGRKRVVGYGFHQGTASEQTAGDHLCSLCLLLLVNASPFNTIDKRYESLRLGAFA